jgi:hypothetical protein
MKKTGIGFFLLMGAALLSAQTAYIQETSGTVEVKAPGAAEWKTAVPGQELEPASLVSTGFRSTALVRIGNSTITLRPLTRLSLEAITAAQNDEELVLNLRSGRVRADVRPPAGGRMNFSVRAPTVTASVRGTVFEFDGLRLSVEEGRLHLGGENAMGTYVGAGHSTEFNPETGSSVPVAEVLKEALTPPLPAGVDELQAAQAAALLRTGLGIGFYWPEE